MTNRNELERLLAAATKGPWRFDHDWARIPTIHAPDGVEIANVLKLGFPHRDNRTPEQEANAALICFLRNNAQHYLSLMGEVDRLREALQDIFADVQVAVDVNMGAYEDPTSEQLISRAKRIARQALGETHDR